MLKKKLWLLDFANRKFGKQPVAELDVSEILKALGKMERRGRHESATCLRSTVGAVFRLAMLQDQDGHLRRVS